MGLLYKFVEDQLWTLASNDNGIIVEGQFIIDSLTHDKSSNLGSLSALGRETPIVSFLSGDVEKLSFQAIIFSMNYWDNIEEKIEDLFAMATPDENTGVYPVCNFFHGQFARQVLVKSLGGITYREPKYDGALKQATFNIELWRFEDYAYYVTSASGQERETKYVLAKTGDYYELIAAREYGNALLGVNMRQLHDLPILQPGDPVKVLRRTHSKILKPIKPETNLLDRSDKTVDAQLTDFFATRRRSKFSFVI